MEDDMPHEKQIEQRLRFLQLDEAENSRTLEDVKALVDGSIDQMLDEFYGHLLNQPELARLLSNEEARQRARNGQKGHWQSILFARNLGKKHVEEMQAVGEVHVKVGLVPSWYLSAYCFMLNRFLDRIVEHYRDDPRRVKAALQALNKAVFLDISFVIDSYIEAKNANMKELLRRATNFTDDVTVLIEGLTQTAESLNAQVATLSSAGADAAAVQAIGARSERLSSQVVELNERLSQLTRGDRLRIVERNPATLRQRVKAFLDRYR
jgi:hypothetical protein